jgi:hypothetical protein
MGATSQSLALTGLDASFISNPVPDDAQHLYILDYRSLGSLKVPSRSLRNLRNGIMDPETAVKATLKDGLVNPIFGIESVGIGYQGPTGRQVQDFQFKFNGFPLCDFSVTAHTRTGSDPIILGKIPGFQPVLRTLTAEDFPTVQGTVDRIVWEIGQGSQGMKVTQVSRCLKTVDGQWVTALKVALTAGGLPYTAVADDTNVFDLNGLFFSVSGTVSAYKKNAVDGLKGSFTVDLVGDSHLTSSQLTTTTGAISRATAADHQFNYTASDPEFAEANAFAHVNSIVDWFKGLGYKWITPVLTIRTREDIPVPGGASKDNALYVPSGFQPLSGAPNSGPVIAVADGSGSILRDLPTDSDVVTHEFGHHVLFKKLKSTTVAEARDGSITNLNHSAILHEGLADFFTFAYTGDACLAESICPPNTTACVVMTAQKQCLRSGSNDLIYDSDAYWNLGKAVHLKGQLVSATMWDIRNRPGVSADDFTKIAYASVDFLLATSSYTDWLVALMSADKDLFDGKYGCDIVDAAKKRGFTALIADKIPDCANFKTDTTVAGSPPNPPNTDTKSDVAVDDGSKASDVPVEKRTESTSKNKKFCGTIALTAGDPGYAGLILLIFLTIPLLTVAPRTAVVRVRKNKIG